ncbi:MAG TPA: choice-of-anchor D domain-containing protein, partial [Puia sp.]|nr:choice-of-anchor D domain-containing protein [Puia sp.]
PTGARTLYAGINGRGVFKSNDGGRNWTQILSGTTPVVAAAIGAGNGFSKTIVALAPPTLPPSPAGIQVLYVTLQGTGAAPDPVGLFISKDQGNTWTQQTATGMPTRTQGGYSFHMAVDPASPGDGINDIIYFGTVGQAKSVDSGATFSSIPVPHADTHAWAFVLRPGLSSIVYCGNDGGIDRSLDGGATWNALGGGGLQTGLFYNIDIRPDAAGSVTVGALQDNEIETTKGAPGLGWNATEGGDGWDVAYDSHIAGQVYGSSGFWSPAPCTRVHRSTDDGSTFGTEITPWTTATDTGCFLAPVTTDPSTGGILYVSGSQNLWQSLTGGGSWRILSPFPGTGNVDVAPANGNNVVIAVGSRVFLSTNALLPTVGLPAGVTFTEITRNLPGRNVARACFDPTDPTIIYAVLGGFSGIASGPSKHVFRTTVGASSWTDISPDLDLPCNALALDGTDTPTTIYVGTDFGVLRSVDIGATWYVLDDIHFPRAPVLDLIYSRGHLRAATYGRGVFQFVLPTGPAIAVDLPEGLAFGTVCKGPAFQLLKIYNVGVSDLIIFSVQRLMGSTAFSVAGTPGTPLIISPGEEIDFTIQYTPVSTGSTDTATIRISSNDPGAPFVDLAVTGTKGTGRLETAIADSGSFGNVCLGSFADELLTINNSGPCPLSITNITSSSADFKAPGVTAYPLVVSPGGSLDVMIRFQPTAFGAAFATITISSDDPASPHTIAVSGIGQQPRQVLMIADSGNFGNCCIGSFVDKPLTV